MPLRPRLAPCFSVAFFLLPLPALADESPFHVSAASEVSFYQDTDYTTVATPEVSGTVENVLGEWGVTGTFGVDVVSTASVDIVATASRRWSEVRYGPALTAHKRWDDLDVSVRGSVSHEPDYLSIAGGGTLALRPHEQANYAFVLLRPCRRHRGPSRHAVLRVLPPDLPPKHRDLNDHRGGLVHGRHPRYHRHFRDGRRLKALPYDPHVRRNHGRGGRSRYGSGHGQRAAPARATLGAVAHRQATLRAQRASCVGKVKARCARRNACIGTVGASSPATSDFRYLYDVSDGLRLGLHLRMHAQSGVDFWQLAYVARETSASIEVAPHRGPGAWPALHTHRRHQRALCLDRSSSLYLTPAVDVAYTRFLDHLFIEDRVSVLGAATLEVDFQ